jgi:hypothetical protein
MKELRIFLLIIENLLSQKCVLILILCGYFLTEERKTRKKAKLADQYN